MINVNHLTKKYGQHTAVNDISFTVSKGEIVGFLGPNGAGKTTTMSIMTGYNSATEGSVSINGFDILDKPIEAKKQIGYLPDAPPVYGDMTVLEYLRFVADIKRVKKSSRKGMMEEIIQTVKIEDVAKRVIKNLSKGYQQRVGLAQALIGFPEVLILDEPTVGLDPKQIIEMRDVIKNLGKRHTVILSSHLLYEVSAVCDRVLIIDKGRLVASGDPESLAKNMAQKNRLFVRVKGDTEQVQQAFKVTNEPFVTSLSFEGSREAHTVDAIIEGDEGVDIRERVFYALAGAGLPIYQMKAVDVSLEEIFLKVTDGHEAGATRVDEKEVSQP